jgi:hypothetical protein
MHIPLDQSAPWICQGDLGRPNVNLSSLVRRSPALATRRDPCSSTQLRREFRSNGARYESLGQRPRTWKSPNFQPQRGAIIIDSCHNAPNFSTTQIVISPRWGWGQDAIDLGRWPRLSYFAPLGLKKSGHGGTPKPMHELAPVWDRFRPVENQDQLTCVEQRGATPKTVWLILRRVFQLPFLACHLCYHVITLAG